MRHYFLYPRLFVPLVGVLLLVNTALLSQYRGELPKNTLIFYCPQANALSFSDAQGRQIRGVMKADHLTKIETDVDTLIVNYATQNDFSLNSQLIEFTTARTQYRWISGFGAYEPIRLLTKEQLGEHIRQTNLGVFRVYYLDLEVGLKLIQESK